MIEQGIELNAIYQHYKGNFYRIVCVAYHHEDNTKALVIYHKCDENGVFQSIRMNAPSFDNDENKAIIVGQPFYRDVEEFLETVTDLEGDIVSKIPRFKFIKKL